MSSNTSAHLASATPFDFLVCVSFAHSVKQQQEEQATAAEQQCFLGFSWVVIDVASLETTHANMVIVSDKNEKEDCDTYTLHYADSFQNALKKVGILY